jgi:hypothetical protein
MLSSGLVEREINGPAYAFQVSRAEGARDRVMIELNINSSQPWSAMAMEDSLIADARGA